ncbi:cytokine receptor-like factor 2, partial [Dipodomys merriami]|uniref:cytokine receptor-like factor 2 n=1 Tax=Dipodomys merriami TaxID=94247 RepID=UPI00385604CE
CALGVRGDILHLTLRDGGRALLNLSRYVADFLKPATLRDLRFLWSPDGAQVTVCCPDLPYRGLSYQVQHRAAHDPAWQTHEETTCAVTVAGLDPGLCLSFRARAAPRPAVYGSEAQPGDWMRETHWRGGRPAERDTPTDRQTDRRRDGRASAAVSAERCDPSPASVPALGLALPCGLATSLLLLLCVWRLSRVKQRLLPWVPDPRGSFPGLFETHHGHFQIKGSSFESSSLEDN